MKRTPKHDTPADTKSLDVEKVQKIAAPIAIGVAVAAGIAMSFVQIRRQNVRRRKWTIPLLIAGALLVAGLVGATIEYAINTQPSLSCANGTYQNAEGMQTCRAVFSTSAPAGATALCNDGAYSFNRSAGSLCSLHGGTALTL